MKKALLGILLSSIMVSVSASPWVVDSKNSNVNFISTKKVNVAEVHQFHSFSGQLDDSGRFTLSIDLASVWTNVEIRDTRMKEQLFEVAKFPKLSLSASIDTGVLHSITIGGTSVLDISAELTLHGVKQTMPITVTVAKLSKDQIMVVSTQPTIINAANFELSAGIEKLREIAGLTSISQAVPVSFILTLNR